MFQGGACAIYLGGDHNQVQGCTFGGQGEWMSNGITKYAGTGLDTNLDERSLGAAIIDSGNDTATIIKGCHFNEAKVGIFEYAAEGGRNTEGTYEDNYFEPAVARPTGPVATIISDDDPWGFLAKDNCGFIGGVYLASDLPYYFSTTTAPTLAEFTFYDGNLPGLRFVSAAQWNNFNGFTGGEAGSIEIQNNSISGANLFSVDQFSSSATNTLPVTSTGITNNTLVDYLLTVTAGTGLALKDPNGNQFMTPVLGDTVPLKPGWRFTGTAVTAQCVQFP